LSLKNGSEKAEASGSNVSASVTSGASGAAAGDHAGRQSASAQAFHQQLAATVAQRIAAGAYKVPLLPQVASQVVTLTASANVDAGKISALIHRDPSLAGQVLRIANSAAYAPRMPIVSLQQAVARLGFNVIAEIAFAASLQSGIFKVPGHEGDLKLIWRHALASGIWGKEIARVRRANVESAFLCGLLHAVGKPALLQVLVDVARELKGAPEGPWLHTYLRDNHQPLGRRVAETWELPSPVLTAITHHVDYSQAGAQAIEAKTTCLADRLATWVVEIDAFDDKTLRDHPVFVDLNLYPDDVSALLAKRDVVLGVVEALMVV
jgi:HD-like signal output (HDOD) protein